MKLENKVAIVTGGAQGIGKSIAVSLAKEGANLVIVDVNLEKAIETAKEIEAMGRKTLALKVDVSNLTETEEMVKTTVEKLGSLDILVNNAGITRDALLMRMKEEDWDLVMKVNLKGPFNCTKAAVKVMTKQRSGRIINIASIVGLMGNAGQANYSASKGGLIAFTKTVAREVASRSVTCNAIAPGFIDTAMTEVLSDDVKKALTDQIPMGKLGSPDDIAESVLFLASDSASYITGHVISVNGGMYM